MEKTDLELRPADPEGSVPRYLHAWVPPRKLYDLPSTHCFHLIDGHGSLFCMVRQSVYGKEQTAVLYRLQASERWSDEASTDRSYVGSGLSYPYGVHPTLRYANKGTQSRSPILFLRFYTIRLAGAGKPRETDNEPSPHFMPPRHGTTAVVVSCPPSLQQLTTPTVNDFTLGAAVSSGKRIPNWLSTAMDADGSLASVVYSTQYSASPATSSSMTATFVSAEASDDPSFCLMTRRLGLTISDHSERRQGAAVIHAGRTSMLLEHVFSKAFISGVDVLCPLSQPPTTPTLPADPVCTLSVEWSPTVDGITVRRARPKLFPLARVVSHAVTAVITGQLASPGGWEGFTAASVSDLHASPGSPPPADTHSDPTWAASLANVLAFEWYSREWQAYHRFLRHASFLIQAAEHYRPFFSFLTFTMISPWADRVNGVLDASQLHQMVMNDAIATVARYDSVKSRTVDRRHSMLAHLKRELGLMYSDISRPHVQRTIPAATILHVPQPAGISIGKRNVAARWSSTHFHGNILCMDIWAAWRRRDTSPVSFGRPTESENAIGGRTAARCCVCMSMNMTGSNPKEVCTFKDDATGQEQLKIKRPDCDARTEVWVYQRLSILILQSASQPPDTAWPRGHDNVKSVELDGTVTINARLPAFPPPPPPPASQIHSSANVSVPGPFPASFSASRGTLQPIVPVCLGPFSYRTVDQVPLVVEWFVGEADWAWPLHRCPPCRVASAMEKICDGLAIWPGSEGFWAKEATSRVTLLVSDKKMVIGADSWTTAKTVMCQWANQARHYGSEQEGHEGLAGSGSGSGTGREMPNERCRSQFEEGLEKPFTLLTFFSSAGPVRLGTWRERRDRREQDKAFDGLLDW
ncbi:uncharacterized protein CLUP02_15419 [Colletotrichum lupini]|uniref:Uncharacterized protein n=1 Tax=Colletotrichum lupini TaxID=145971 RepID=A0A9Q8WN95_9PEZI|nr:uncharacterized protein CLUP02_15419 [Colletotrichum lupini]UQC89888.1 hypothetical protein CLUP02_15419 [Colletotrichum lupini]